ncbi:aromatic amino acid transport family protein [Chlamydia sp. 17-3921]|uniref:aromatic amino acid transport family protein n=1 Tax=Chlamydia sp. 17-3921 TaxID=2675798 RepID=UPI0019188075|nr:aromatic amino acid transport family protein [Chlamydia sp. 17-3921]
MSNKIIGGSLLIAGTAIGAGVLAVPVLTAEGGFFPATWLYILSWLFSMTSGLYLLEVMTWLKDKKQVNMLSMAECTLGQVGKVMMCLVYLFLFYSLLIAYFCEGGNIFFRVFGCLGDASPWIRHLGPLAFACLMCPILLSKTVIIDYYNRILMLGLVLTFGAFCVFGFGKIQLNLLCHSSWKSSLSGLPILFLAFGFQSVVPTLYYYMDKNVRNVRRAIFLGSLLPLGFYILWEAIVLGGVPLSILNIAKTQGFTAVEALKQTLQCSSIYILGELFGFFALVSSFVGVALGVMDFLADGLKWNKKTHSFSIFFLTFIIPLSWSICYPEIVLKCLNYAGGLGAALIIGFFPIWMVWRGRYGKVRYSEKHLVPGGRITLILMLLIIVINVVSLYY